MSALHRTPSAPFSRLACWRSNIIASRDGGIAAHAIRTLLKVGMLAVQHQRLSKGVQLPYASLFLLIRCRRTAEGTETGIPMAQINLRSGSARNWGWASGTSCSFSLSFAVRRSHKFSHSTSSRSHNFTFSGLQASARSCPSLGPCRWSLSASSFVLLAAF